MEVLALGSGRLQVFCSATPRGCEHRLLGVHSTQALPKKQRPVLWLRGEPG